MYYLLNILYIYFLLLFNVNYFVNADSRVRISMIGDILMHQLATKRGMISDTEYDFDYMFGKFNVNIKDFDVNIVNLEVLLNAKNGNLTYFPRFSNRFEVADSLVKFGYNVILKATNHSYDYKKQGIITELKEWKEKYPNILVTGAYLTKKDSQKITFITKKGIKMAILNFTRFTNRGIPKRNKYLINSYRDKRFEENIERAKKGGAEYIIVCMHWGREYNNNIHETQKNLVKKFYNLGVDLVIGTHPHVIQPVQWYSESGNERKMLVYYSLGNFINASNTRRRGRYRVFCNGMAYIEIERNKETNKIETKVGKFVPLITHIDLKQDLVQTYLVKDYNIELAENNGIIKRNDNSFNYWKMYNHFDEFIHDEFLDYNFHVNTKL